MPDFKLGGSYSYWAYYDISGGKFKNDKLRKNWKNQLVCAEDYETRHPLDFYRPRNDTHVLNDIRHPEGKEPYIILGEFDAGYTEYSTPPVITDSLNDFTITATPTSDWTTNTTTSEWTFCVWMKPLFMDNQFCTIFSTRGLATSGGFSIEIGGTDSSAIQRGAMQILQGVNAVIGPRTVHRAVKVGEWIHLAITRNSSGGYQIYLNGDYTQTIRQALNGLNAWVGNSDPVYIGRPTASSGRKYFGSLKDIRIFNVAKTQTQIQRYMNDYRTFSSTESGLIGWWKLNEGGGNILADSQTNYSPMNFSITDSTNVTWDYDER